MAVAGIKADSDDFHVLSFQRVDAVAEAAGFLGATWRVVFGIEIEQHNFLADVIGEFPGVAGLILAFDERSLVPDFGHRGGIRRKSRHAGGQADGERNCNGVQFHNGLMG